MGLKSKGDYGSNLTFLQVLQGKLVIANRDRDSLESKVEDLGLDPDDIVSYEVSKGDNAGQERYFIEVGSIEGMLTGVSIQEAPFGDVLEIRITDGDESFNISLGMVDSKVAKDFIRRMDNLDLDNLVEFSIWHIPAERTERGSAMTGVKMAQDNTKVEYALTYDDLPAPIEKKKMGKTTWDYTDQVNYLYEKLVEFIRNNFAIAEDTHPETENTDKGADAPKEEEKPKPAAKTPTKGRSSKKAPKKVAKRAAPGEPVDDLPF